jgi:hypothetical protein
MPYIRAEDRKKCEEGLGQLNPLTVGELNYVVTMICLKFIRHHGVSYSRWNDVVGALECAKLELYRRFIGPYESEKEKENGGL